ncbi:MAG: Flp pilus assembly complex ATPase component TadA [Microthrixaceae bacterium]|nr:Flp pilus assembly complex ATPase component TadA [Microthrixaceae bacterium]
MAFALAPNPAPDSTPSPEPARRRLGDILVDRGFVTDEQLGDALALQKTTNRRLGEVLLQEGLVTPAQLMEALADQLGFPFINLDGLNVDHTLVQKVPEPLARRHRAVPVRMEDGNAVVAMANPADVIALDDLRSILRVPIRAVMADPDKIIDTINRSRQGDEQVQNAIRMAVQDAGEVETESDLRVVETARDEAPIIRFVDLIIGKAVQERASDIHIEATQTSMRIRYRIDGVLHEVMHPPRALQPGIISRVKVMAGMDIAEKRVPQDGRASMVVGGRAIDLRIASVPTVYGEAVVARILRREDGLMRLVDLDMHPSQFERFQNVFKRTWGIVLVTGPTGSGKTTTLYSALRELNEPSRNIMTVEDPVEYRMEGLKQMQTNVRAGLTFATALKSMLRADPDVILVGEIREKETATIAVEASLTGHLVLASLHTNDASSTPLRLIEMGLEPYLVVAGLRGILAQRLARRLCDMCKTPRVLAPELAAAAGIPPHLCGADGSFATFDSQGCQNCSGTGYRGRFAVNEFLEVSETLSHMILEQRPSREIERQAIEEGMFTMKEAGLRKVQAGLTTIEDLYRCIG